MRSRWTRPTAMALTRGLPPYSGAKPTSPPRFGTPKQLPYQLIPDTTPSTRRRVIGSAGSPKRSESRIAMGRAPIVKMSRRMPPTPVAAPWNGSMKLGWLWLSILNVRARSPPRSTMPAFSPGPWSTCGPVVGRRRRNTRECLYAQCSDQSAENSPSSVKVGSRSSRRMMRSYSSAVRPWLSASSRVTLGSAPVTPSPSRQSPLEERAVLDQAAEERMEHEQAIGAAHGALRRPLRMRHEPEHGAGLVDDPRDVVERPVRVGLLGRPAVLGAVAEDDLLALAQALQGRVVREELALAVGDRHLEHLPRPHRARERRVR